MTREPAVGAADMCAPARSAGAIGAGVGAAALPRRRALAIAAATLWLPALLPLVLGVFRNHGDMLQPFLLWVPIIPGMLFAVLLRADDLLFVLAGAVPTLFAFVALYAGVRELPTRWLHAVQTAVMVLVAAQAVIFSQLLLA